MAERIGQHIQCGDADIFVAKPSLVVAKTYRKYLEQQAWQKTKEMVWLSADEMKEALSDTRRDIIDGKYAIGGKAYSESKNDGDNANHFLWLMLKDSNPTLTLEGYNRVLAEHGDKINTAFEQLFSDKEPAKN